MYKSHHDQVVFYLPVVSLLKRGTLYINAIFFHLLLRFSFPGGDLRNNWFVVSLPDHSFRVLEGMCERERGLGSSRRCSGIYVDAVLR